MLNKGMVTGMAITGIATRDALGICEPCIKGKHARHNIEKVTHTRANAILRRVFSDLCGPMQTRSHEGFEHFATFIDDKSHKVTVRGLKQKSDLHERLADFVAQAELETGGRVKILRTDGGGEYTGERTQKYLRECGIKHEMTTADTPQHNGVTEQMNRTQVETARTLLTDANLPNSYWYDAVEYAAYLHNLVPTRSLELDQTPEEAWSGNKPNVSLLRVFGCKAYSMFISQTSNAANWTRSPSSAPSSVMLEIAARTDWYTDQVGVLLSHAM
jgi:transposase InsO family protein